MLGGHNGVLVLPKSPNERRSIGHVLPVHTFGSAQGCFFNFPMRGRTREPAKKDLLGRKSIAQSESSSDVMKAAQVVKHQHKGIFFLNFECLDGHPLDLLSL